MKTPIVWVLLGVLIGVIPSLLSAQQSQNTQKSNPEIEALEQRISKLEKRLQTVENVEKMELQAKLSEANTKLLNAEFGRFERELRDSNDEWLIKWGIFILAIVSVFGVAFWFALKSLIANGVEKNLDGFKEAVGQVELMKNQLGVFEKKYTISTLEDFINNTLVDERSHFEQIKGLGEEPLLDIFDDEEKNEAIRYKAAEVLIARKSPRLVSPMLKFLNSVVDSESHIDNDKELDLRAFTNFFAYVPTQETHDGLDKFLNRLLTENLKHSNLFLTVTVFSLAWVSLKLNIGDSVSTLRLAIPGLEIRQTQSTALKNLARYFDIFNEPEGIKEMLTCHGTNLPTEVIDKCLELLQKHDPAFVETWRTQNAQDNTESS